MSVDCEITILVLLSNNQTRKQQQRCGPKHSEPTVILGAAAPQTPRGASVLSGLRLNASMSIGATQGMHPPVGHACAVRARWSWSTCRRVSRVQGQSIPQRIKIKTTMPVLSACVCVCGVCGVCVCWGSSCARFPPFSPWGFPRGVLAFIQFSGAILAQDVQSRSCTWCGGACAAACRS